MAGRPPKKGIDFAGWSVDVFDNDPKIDKLLDARGWEGFGVYFYLCQRAYGGEGYFYQWSYDDSASTARKMGCGISAGTVRETVGYCLHIGLFDKELFDRQGILTSRGIQKRYCMAIKDRDIKEVVSEYWLLRENEECKGLIKLPLNTDLSEGNTNFPAGNSNYDGGNANFNERKESKEKERKENKSKDACVTRASRFNDFFQAYPKQKNMVAAEKEYMLLLFNDQSLDEQDLVTSAKNYSEAVSILGTEERYIKNPDRFLSEGRYMDYLDANYKKPDPPKKGKPAKNKFNDFTQREYDMGDLESRLLGNGGDGL